jgi:hypothetical protein
MVSCTAGFHSQGNGEMCLSHPRIAYQNQIGLVPHKVTACQLPQEHGLHIGTAVAVKFVHGFYVRKLCLLYSALLGTGLAFIQLPLQQFQKESIVTGGWIQLSFYLFILGKGGHPQLLCVEPDQFFGGRDHTASLLPSSRSYWLRSVLHTGISCFLSELSSGMLFSSSIAWL